MGLDVKAAGVTTAQVAQQVQGMTTSSRLYTQMVPQAGDTVSATTTAEQPFASSYTIPANSLVIGQAIIVKGAGIYSTSALLPPSSRARLRAGATGPVLIDSGPIGVLISLSSARYMFDLQFIVRSLGVNGTVEAFGKLDYAQTLAAATTILCGPSGAVGDIGNPVTIDTTQPITITLTTTFSSVATGNTNSLRQLSIHSLKPPS